jgi:hypothetical protein
MTCVPCIVGAIILGLGLTCFARHVCCNVCATRVKCLDKSRLVQVVCFLTSKNQLKIYGFVEKIFPEC